MTETLDDDARSADPDLYYLAETLADLQAAVRLCDVTAYDATDLDVQALTRRTLAAQARLTRATNRCLRAWGLDEVPPTTSVPPVPV